MATPDARDAANPIGRALDSVRTNLRGQDSAGLIVLFKHRSDVVGGEIVDDPFSASGRVQAVDVAGGLDELLHRAAAVTGLAVQHGFRVAAPIRADHRRAARLRLQGHVAQRLDVLGRT